MPGPVRHTQRASWPSGRPYLIVANQRRQDPLDWSLRGAKSKAPSIIHRQERSRDAQDVCREAGVVPAVAEPLQQRL